MIPPQVLTGIISGAAGLGQGGLGLLGQVIQNQQQKKLANQAYQHDLDMWKRQNQQNIAMWEMQNAYNTPAAQMQRYQDAGLNPNLIYSQGNPGNAAQVGQSQQAKYNAPDYQMPLNKFFNFTGMLDQYMDLTIKQKQSKNLDEQNKLLTAQVLNTIAGKDLREQKLDFTKQIFPYQLQGAELRNVKLSNEVNYLANQIKLGELQLLKENYNWENYYRQGTTPTDNFIFRFLARISDGITEGIYNIISGGGKRKVPDFFKPNSIKFPSPIR